MTSRIAIVLATSLAIAAFACSSADQPTNDPVPRKETSPTNPDKSKAPANNNGGSNSGGNDQQTTPGGGETTPSADGAACLKEANADGCFTCCDKIDPKAFDDAYKASDDCLCNAQGPCKTQCANSVCKGNQPDQACQACLQTQPAQKCDDVFVQTCEKSASCKSVMACGDKCADKFPDQGGQGGGNGG